MKKTMIVVSGMVILSGCSSFGGSRHDEVDKKVQTIESECRAQWESSTFNPIRTKIEYYPSTSGASESETYRNKRPTQQESNALNAYAQLYKECKSRAANAYYASSPYVATSSIKQTNKELNLIRRLADRQLTWGQFNSARYDVLNNRLTETNARNERLNNEYYERSRAERQRTIDNAARVQRDAMPIRTSCTRFYDTVNCTSTR